MKLLVPVILILMSSTASAELRAWSFVEAFFDETTSPVACITLVASDESSGSSQGKSQSEEEEEPDCE